MRYAILGNNLVLADDLLADDLLTNDPLDKEDNIYTCPGCRARLILVKRSGRYKAHFRHSGHGCYLSTEGNPDYENKMSDFCIQWQKAFPINHIEQEVDSPSGGINRADVLIPYSSRSGERNEKGLENYLFRNFSFNALVVEFQYPHIPYRDLRRKQNNYVNESKGRELLWIFDIRGRIHTLECVVTYVGVEYRLRWKDKNKGPLDLLKSSLDPNLSYRPNILLDKGEENLYVMLRPRLDYVEVAPVSLRYLLQYLSDKSGLEIRWDNPLLPSFIEKYDYEAIVSSLPSMGLPSISFFLDSSSTSSDFPLPTSSTLFTPSSSLSDNARRDITEIRECFYMMELLPFEQFGITEFWRQKPGFLAVGDNLSRISEQDTHIRDAWIRWITKNRHVFSFKLTHGKHKGIDVLNMSIEDREYYLNNTERKDLVMKRMELAQYSEISYLIFRFHNPETRTTNKSLIALCRSVLRNPEWTLPPCGR